MIDVNKSAFSNLIEQFVQRSILPVEEGIRYIKTDEEGEKDWLKHSNEFEILFITPNLRLIQFKFSEERYFGIIGIPLDTSDFDVSVLEYLKLNAGIVTLLISLDFLKLDKKSNLLEFYDLILFQHKDPKYLGHDYIDLLPFLEEIYLFRSPEYSIVKNQNLSRIACYTFAKNPLKLVLDFEKDVTELISELSLVGSDTIYYKLLLGCLFSTTYKHAFLELYRLLERLFPINYLKEFHEKTGSTLTFLDFTSELEDITSWRPKEEEAIEKIFNITKPTTRKHFEDFHNSSVSLQGQRDYKYFYTLRNSIVHYRANHLDQELTKEQWNMLLIATLFLLDEQYSANNELLILE